MDENEHTKWKLIQSAAKSAQRETYAVNAYSKKKKYLKFVIYPFPLKKLEKEEQIKP